MSSVRTGSPNVTWTNVTRSMTPRESMIPPSRNEASSLWSKRSPLKSRFSATNRLIWDSRSMVVGYLHRRQAQVGGGPALAREVIEGALDLHLRQSHGLGDLGPGSAVLQGIREPIHRVERQTEEELFLRARRAVGVGRRRAAADRLGDAQVGRQLVDLGLVEMPERL